MNQLVKNKYGYWSAESCRKTGLPMLNQDTYKPYADKWLSKTRCKAAKSPVQESEEPVAFYRVPHGYVSLYDRTASESECWHPNHERPAACEDCNMRTCCAHCGAPSCELDLDKEYLCAECHALNIKGELK